MANINGTGWGDSLEGTDAVDTIDGGYGNDYLDGKNGADTLLGGEGDDYVVSAQSSATDPADTLLDGGGGSDTLDLDKRFATVAITYDITRTGDQILAGTTVRNFERLIYRGGSNSDIITGGALDDELYGNDGNDTLVGGGGDDWIDGGLGNDTVNGGDGNDNVNGHSGADTILGGAGDDTLRSILDSGGPADVLVDGGDGIDMAVISGAYLTGAISFSIADPAVNQSLAGGIYRNIERIEFYAGSGADVVTGGALDDKIVGNGGNDTLNGGAGNDQLYGGLGNDTLNGGVGDDRLEGLEGDDTADGGDGNDSVLGYDGNDTLRGGAGNDIVNGEKGADSLEGGDGDDFLYSNTYTGDTAKDILIDGGAGHDGASIDKSLSTVAITLSIADPAVSQTADGTVVRGVEFMNYYGGSGIDRITGGAWADNIYGNGGNDVLSGGDGVDRLEGGLGDDTLNGGADNDALVGFDGNDILRGDAGNDQLNGEKGADSLEGGDGDDLLFSYTYTGDATKDTLLDGGAGADYALIDKTTSVVAITLSIANPALSQTADGTTIRNIERIDYYGGTVVDTITGGALADQIYGNAGNDVLNGGGGNDILNGGTGNDSVTGGAGSDFVDGGQGADSLFGGDDDDQMLSYTYAGDATKDVLIDGGAGTDYLMLDKSTSTVAITFSLANPSVDQLADGTTVRNVEYVDFYGGSAIDTITGGGFADKLYGNGGNDVLSGAGGIDQLYGASGDDRLTGGAGDDKVDGGEGSDTVVFSGAKSDYDIMNYGSFVQFRDKRAGGDGIDQVLNTEKVQFSDGLFDMAAVATRMVRPFLTDSDQLAAQSVQARDASLTFLTGGGYAVVYAVQESATNYDQNIIVKLFDANDNLLSTQTVNTLTAGNQSRPVIQATANGGFMVAWDTYVVAADGWTVTSYDVKAQIFDAAGVKTGTEFKVSSGPDFKSTIPGYDLGEQSSAQTDLLANGNIVMVFRDRQQSGTGTDTNSIRVQVFDPVTGAKVGSEFAASTSSSPYYPDVAVLANGNYVVTWSVEGGTLNDGSGAAVKAQMFTASGAKIGSEFLVNTTTTGYQSSPKIAALGDGGFVIVWGDGSAGYQQSNSVGQIFNSAGAKVGGEFKVNTLDDGDESPISVTSLSTGGFVVTYQHLKYAGNITDYVLLGQAYSATGQKIGHEFIIGDANSSGARPVEMPNGDFGVVYTSYGTDGLTLQKYTFVDANVAPTFRSIADTVAFTENGSPIALAGTVYVDDWGSNNYAGGSLTIAATTGQVAGDVIGLLASATPGTGLEISGDQLKYNGVVIGTMSIATGSLTIAFNAASSDAAVKAIAEAATFGSTSDNPGTSRVITFTLVDGGGTANGGSDTTSFTRNVTVTPVNDLPVGANSNVTFLDNAPYVFKWADFGFSDADGSTGYIRFSTLPSSGTILINGSPVSLSSNYSKSFFDSGDIEFRPVQGTTDSQASISFRVADQFGQNSTLYTLGLNITAVNDAPVTRVSNLALATGELAISDISNLGVSGQKSAVLADGTILVTWTEVTGLTSGYYGQYASNSEVRGQLYSANGSKIGSTITVNSATAGLQDGAQIIALDNRFLVVWRDQSEGVGGTGGDAAGGAVKAQFIGSDGIKIGSEILVNTATLSNQAGAEVVKLANGGFAIAWHDYSQGVGGAAGDASAHAVKLQLFDASGTKVGPEQLVNSATASDQYIPKVSALAGGGVVVVWEDRSLGVGGATGDASQSAIKAQFFGADGAKIGDEILVNSAVNGNQNSPSVVTLANGNVVISWTDYSSGVGGATGDSSSLAVKAQLFTSAGVKIGGEILVNTITANSQSGQQVIALSNGGFAIAWTDSSQNVGGQAGGDSTSSAVKLQLFGADGAKVGGEVLVNTATVSLQSLSSLAALPNGGFIVTWNDMSQGVGGATGDPSLYAVKAQIFGADGIRFGSEFLVNTTTANSQLSAHAVAMPNGGVFVSWTDASVAPSYGGASSIKGLLIRGTIEWDALARGTVDLKGALSVADADAGTSVITVTMSVLNGTLHITPGTSGVTVKDNGTNSIVLTGTLAQINAVLRDDPASTVRYQSPGDVLLSADQLTLAVSDNGTVFPNGALSGSTTISFGTYSHLGTSANDAITGTATGDSINGRGGDDVINGGAGADLLTGGAGRDVLTGGAGGDVFRDTAARLNGDTITDLTFGDSIIVSDAVLSEFSISRSGNVLNFTGGSITVPATRALFLTSEAPGGGVRITIAHDVSHDFNGDGRSDLAWQHVAGTFTTWLGQPGGTFVNNPDAGANALDVSWRVAGFGDFNGDGRDDILWRHNSGEIGQWLGLADGKFANNGGAAANPVPNDWSVVGVADYNGDGRDDILWRHVSGEVGQWVGLPSGGFANNGGAAANAVDPSWTVVANGDFNGDGRADVLWRHTSGAYAEWQGSATGALSNAGGVMGGATGSVVGAGDFNGDGRDDVLFRAGNGAITVWLGQSSGQFTSFTPARQLNDLDWKIASIGDFNGDGRDDLLWRHTSGAAGEWLGTGTGDFTHNGALPTVDTSWQIQAPDFFLA